VSANLWELVPKGLRHGGFGSVSAVRFQFSVFVFLKQGKSCGRSIPNLILAMNVFMET